MSIDVSCVNKTLWPQANGVTVFTDISTALALSPAHTQLDIRATGYLNPTGTVTGVEMSTDTLFWLPLKGPVHVTQGSAFFLRRNLAAAGALTLSIWPEWDFDQMEANMLEAYMTNSANSVLVDIYDILSNRDFSDTQTGLANAINSITVSDATWTGLGSRWVTTGFQIWTEGGSVAADATATIRYNGTVFYSCPLGAGLPRGSVAGFENMRIRNLAGGGDVVFTCPALGAGVISTINVSAKITK